VLSVLSIPIHLLPDDNVAHFLANRTISLGTAWASEVKRAPLSPTEQVLKRAMDVSLASICLIVLAPLMALVAAMLRLESAGPIFFIQTRNGFNGETFGVRKFRTMRVAEDGLVIRQATRNDPRVTRLGRVLRRSSIDELPQLFNVITGDMSLVGPRPHAVAHNSEYQKLVDKYAHRYQLKPGITGWAQVNGFRGEIKSVEMMAKRVEFDLWYINNWSLLLDIKILFRTLVVLAFQSNAY
jgi:exopolysaccharide biosynthesis polyprenyl glycosylphosphotransferase